MTERRAAIEGAAMHVFSLADECWVVATDRADAWDELAHYGLVEEDFEPDDLRQLDDAEPLDICTVDSNYLEAERKTCAEWVAINGRGPLASTDY